MARFGLNWGPQLLQVAFCKALDKKGDVAVEKNVSRQWIQKVKGLIFFNDAHKMRSLLSPFT